MQQKPIVLALGQGFTTEAGRRLYAHLKEIADLHWYHAPLKDETWRSTFAKFVKKVGKPLVLMLYGARIAQVNEELLAPLVPGLALVASQGAGYDNIDVDYCTRKGIWVANTPDSVTDATANCAVWLILSSLRGLVEANENAKSGAYKGQLSITQDPAGLKLGIVGLGRIGSSVARKMSAFGMEVLYHSRHRASESIERASGNATYVSRLLDLARLCDVVSVHVPLSEATYHLFDKPIFDAFGGATFINTARGKIHDESALIDALKQGKVGKAGLDVFEHEPEIPLTFLYQGELADRVLTTPHIGAYTAQAHRKLEIEMLENVLGVCKGGKPKHPVNKVDTEDWLLETDQYISDQSNDQLMSVATVASMLQKIQLGQDKILQTLKRAQQSADHIHGNDDETGNTGEKVSEITSSTANSTPSSAFEDLQAHDATDHDAFTKSARPDEQEACSRDLRQESSWPARSLKRVEPLSSEEIGLFDPFNANGPRVEMYIQRLRRLASRYGEEAVLHNLYLAMIKVAPWTDNLTSADEAMLDSLDGWIALLRRDFGMTRTEARRKLSKARPSDYSSALHFYSDMMSLMTSAGIKDEDERCDLMTDRFRGRWREVLALKDLEKVDTFRSTLRHLETCIGWVHEQE